jgi:hypothetical protein
MLPDWIELCRLFNAHCVEYPGLRIHVTLDEVTVPVIGKAQLITNKRAVARLQDLADVEELEKLDES